MQFEPRSAFARLQAALYVMVISAGLLVMPTLIDVANAAPHRSGTTTSQCTSAQSSVKKAQHQEAVAKKDVAKAQQALKKAKKAHAHKAAKVKKAKKALKRANQRYDAAKKSVKSHQSNARYACASPTSTTKANGTGKKLNLLAIGKGLPLGPIGVSQLTSLLDQLLPGVSGNLSPDQLTALLAGFNGGAPDPTDALGLLTGALSPTDITSLLGGSPSPAILLSLANDIISQLSGLGGGLPIPGGFDPTGLWNTFSGMFGSLSPTQLGSLLDMVTSAFGTGGSPLNSTQLTGLINSLVPGISNQFDPTQLTSMLAGLNGTGLSADQLSTLLGGQFSPTQLTSVLGGTASPALLSSVITQVIAQLATAGGGGLTLPGPLSAGDATSLITTITSLLTQVSGGGGGVLPVICSVIPIPLLCS